MHIAVLGEQCGRRFPSLGHTERVTAWASGALGKHVRNVKSHRKRATSPHSQLPVWKMDLEEVSALFVELRQWKKRLPATPPSDTEQWKCVADDYFAKANYPNCVGALNGKHVRIVKPCNRGSMYFNYRNYCSVVVLAMCDANYLFTFVDIGAYGKEIKVTKSNSHKRQWYLLPLPYVIVADEAFALSGHVMRPYPKKRIDSEEKSAQLQTVQSMQVYRILLWYA
ncbi:hypothetical protein PR048_028843 [Dryococelus australis]|uniref:DDE Tnp4 domain-containing protein n=1 Tax=Dryococelus australis TaxID=614101 RepID=A0ABQ9GFE0_9NEOP|nr:hypothetical protein PR048_028843 [Dryococelus australis]